LTTNIESRLRAALAAVAQANTKTQAADAAMGRLNEAISAVPEYQGAVNALAIDDAQAFEVWARAGDDTAPPAIDAQAHDAARVALAGAQAQAAAATSAMTRIEADRSKARAHGESAQAAIFPLALLATLETGFGPLVDEVIEHRKRMSTASHRIDTALQLLVDTSKGADEHTRRELLVAMEKFSTDSRRANEFAQIDRDQLRTELHQKINATIDAANETTKGE
jgi:hypothetical protein